MIGPGDVGSIERIIHDKAGFVYSQLHPYNYTGAATESEGRIRGKFWLALMSPDTGKIYWLSLN